MDVISLLRRYAYPRGRKLESAQVDYRVYCMDDEGRIDFADWIVAADIDEAIAKVRELRPHAHRCEIWLKKDLVARLSESGRFELVAA